MERNEIVKKITDCGAVAVLRLNDSSKVLKVIEAIAEGGVTSTEITMTMPNAFEAIELASKTFGNDLLIGVGSVLNKDMAERAINSGAKYVVSPIFKTEIIDAAHSKNIPAMPGCFTPTEIQTAYEYGADVVKVFPADVLGMPFFKGVKAPMPHLKLMPTGGVTLTNAGDWLKAGACAVGVGSALLDKKAIADEDYKKLTENAEIMMRSIEAARGKTLLQTEEKK